MVEIFSRKLNDVFYLSNTIPILWGWYILFLVVSSFL